MGGRDGMQLESLLLTTLALADDHLLALADIRIEPKPKLRSPARELSASDIAVLRGRYDRLALTHRFHDAPLHTSLRGAAGDAVALFDIAETSRICAIGASRWPGVAQNLSALLTRGFLDDEQAAIPRQRADGALQLLLWEALTGETYCAALNWSRKDFRRRFLRVFGNCLDELRAKVHHQADFAQCVLHTLQAIGMGDGGEGQQEGNDARDEFDPIPTDRGSQYVSAPPKPEDESQGEIPTKSTGELRLPGLTQPAEGEPTPALYSAFTKQFDEVISAATLCAPSERECLRARIDEQLMRVSNTIGRLAHRLQRRLMAAQTRRWDFDLEEGILDGARLVRVVANPGLPLPYRQERQSAFPGTIVSFLIDNSGSMRGRLIEVAAVVADILSMTLDRCGVKVEVLGYTTRSWKGGRPYEQWLSAGRPAHPGRLNELRHIVYKSAETPYRRARQDLAVMLLDRLLKENIDGEAIQWACQRLLARREPRRVLVVICDGAPADDQTMAANGKSYLDVHLRETVRWVEETLPIEIIGVGIGHDAAPYYRSAVRIDDVEDLGGAVLDQLSGLLA